MRMMTFFMISMFVLLCIGCNDYRIKENNFEAIQTHAVTEVELNIKDNGEINPPNEGIDEIHNVTIRQKVSIIDDDFMKSVDYLCEKVTADDIRQENLSKTIQILTKDKVFQDVTETHGNLLGYETTLLERLLSNEGSSIEQYMLFMILVEFKVQWYTNAFTWDMIRTDKIQKEMQAIREQECDKLKEMSLMEWAKSYSSEAG